MPGALKTDLWIFTTPAHIESLPKGRNQPLHREFKGTIDGKSDTTLAETDTVTARGDRQVARNPAPTRCT